MKCKKTLCLSFLLYFLITGLGSKVLELDAQEIQLSDSTINFGEVFVGDSLTKSVSLINAGSDTLFIDTLITEEGIYEAFLGSNDTSFVTAGDSIQVFIKFLPDTVNDFTDSLIIVSNTSEVFVYLDGSGVEPPSIVISPEQFNLSVLEGDSVELSLTISNTGDGKLSFSSFVKGLVSDSRKIKQMPKAFYYTSIAEIVPSGHISHLVKKYFNEEIKADTLHSTFTGSTFITALASSTNFLYFVNPYAPDVLKVFDHRTGEVIDSVKVNLDIDKEIGGTVQSLSYSGSSIYILTNLTDIRGVFEIDEYTGEAIDTVFFENRGNINFVSATFNSLENKFYTTNYFDSRIRVFDLSNEIFIQDLVTVQSSHNLSNVSFSYSRNSILAQGYDIDGDSGNQLQVLRELDTETGDLINSYPINSYLTGIATDESSQDNYLSITNHSKNGSIESGLEASIDVIFKADNLEIGSYTSAIILHTNIKDNAFIEIPISINITQPTSVNRETELPTKLELSQNYPNPFNPSTNISYGLPESGNVQIKIYNILGQQIVTLVDGFKQAGRYNATFDAGQLSSGVYFYRMKVDGQELEIKKMLLLK